MTGFSSDELIAINFILTITFLLFLVTVYLFVSSILVRNARKREEQYHEKKNDEFLPVIIEYMVGGDEGNLQKIENLIKSEADIFPILKILYELLESVDGSEIERIREILSIKKLREHHQSNLQSSSYNDKQEACLYYSRLGSLTDSEFDLLTELLNSRNLLLAHVASTAIGTSHDPKRRFKALVSIVKRRRVSRLAILDLLYLFHKTDYDQMEDETELLIQLICDKSLPPDNIAMVIKGICDIGYVGMVDDLYTLIETGYWDENEIIVESLVYAMGRFAHGMSAELIILKYASDARPRLRRACASALELLDDNTFAPTLFELARDNEFSVKMKAIYALAKLGVTGKQYLDQLAEQTTELRNMIRSIVAEVEGGHS